MNMMMTEEKSGRVIQMALMKGGLIMNMAR